MSGNFWISGRVVTIASNFIKIDVLRGGIFAMSVFSVNDSVWIAAAVMSYEKYYKDGLRNISDFTLLSTDIRERGAQINGAIIEAARTSQWCCGDHEHHKYPYLKAIDSNNRRLACPDEFGGGEIPEKIKIDAIIETSAGDVSVQQLIDFVKNDYKAIFSQADKPSHLKEMVEKILNEYAVERNHVFKDNQLGNYVRNDATDIIREAASLSKDQYVITGSVGQGQWAMVSWLGVFNKKITESATKGIYIVYLLNKDGDTLYLTFNQGCTEIRNNKSKKETIRIMHENAAMLRGRLDDHGFAADGAMKLGEGLTELAELYQEGVIFYKGYEKGQVPREAELKKDLLDMIAIYNQYIDEVVYPTLDDNERGEFQEMKESFKFDKNIILYGPPGTGKTYNSATYAVAICYGKSVEELMDYDAVMARYNELKKAGRIAFTTFHQSYGYEEFIEGIKPIIDDNKKDIGYTIEPGIFKKFCEKAKSVGITEDEKAIDAGAKIWKLTIMNGDLNQVKQECFEENNVRMGFGMDSDEAHSFVEEVNPGDIILSLKTRKTIDGIAIVTDEAAELRDKDTYKTARPVKWLAKNIDEDITNINNGKMLHRMTFARVPDMNVQDVIALAGKVNPELGNTIIEENTEPYVFIIDEINRGNISKIFGELITLIESTKRVGMAEAASTVLPYSGEEFSVPSNVYILGTMNTADRSIALIDTALRRRFQFIEMMPDSDVLRKIHADKVEDLDVAAMLDKINERITFLYDREHTIGHAFFTSLQGENATLERLQSIFEKSVIPLLQEYFYEDYQKIQLVLGDNAKSSDDLKFILDEKVVAKSIFKGNVEDVVDLPEKRYTINKKAFGNINSYKEIL